MLNHKKCLDSNDGQPVNRYFLELLLEREGTSVTR